MKMVELNHREVYFWALLESVKFVSPDYLEPEENLLCLMFCAKKQGIDIRSVVSGSEVKMESIDSLTWDTSQAHQELSCQKKKGLSWQPSHILHRNSWRWKWSSSNLMFSDLIVDSLILWKTTLAGYWNDVWFCTKNYDFSW